MARHRGQARKAKGGNVAANTFATTPIGQPIQQFIPAGGAAAAPPPPPPTISQQQYSQPMGMEEVGDPISAEELQSFPGKATVDSGNDVIKKKPWEKVVDGRVVKKTNKSNPGLKNARVRKVCQPKNAMLCLNSICPSLQYNVEKGSNVFCASVMVNEARYTGYGSSKIAAKQAAAEAALSSFMKTVDSPSKTNGDGKDSPDNTPWSALVSFAMYKLFKGWEMTGNNPSTTMPGQFPTIMEQTKINPHMYGGLAEATGVTAPLMSAVNAHLSSIPRQTKQPKTPSMKSHPLKELPATATTMHPVMLLHQMKPDLAYTINKSVVDSSRATFYRVECTVDEQTFYGEGPSMKKAKFCLARDAVKVLFNVESQFGVQE